LERPLAEKSRCRGEGDLFHQPRAEVDFQNAHRRQ